MVLRLPEKKKRELMKLPGIAGVGESDDIIVYVESPEAMAYIPEEVDGLPVKKIPAKFIALQLPLVGLVMGSSKICETVTSMFKYASLSRTSRIRPVVPGISIGHYKVTAGTLTGYAKYGSKIVGLSCNHVIGLNYLGIRIGRQGDPILQPGPYDGGKVDKDTIGYLEKWDELRREAYTDSAIFRLAEDVEHRFDEVFGVGRPRETASPATGMEVVKSGRTTGVTYGVIESVGATIKVYYAKTEYSILHNQVIAYSPKIMSKPGDSGSWVGDSTFNRTIGMLIGGSADYRRSVITPMTEIEKRLGIKFIASPITLAELLGGSISYILSITLTLLGTVKMGGRYEHPVPSH